MNSEDEGFQNLQYDVEIVKIRQQFEQISQYNNYNAINRKLKTYEIAPLSSYTNIKNYITPYFVNDHKTITINQYENIQLKCTLKTDQFWSPQNYEQIQDYFNVGFRCLYNRFNQKNNQNLLYSQTKVYSKKQYKRFIDIESQQILNQKCSSVIQFNSNFESGNLEKVYQVDNNSENLNKDLFLLLSNDTNTDGYNQWFYFKATNLTNEKLQKRFIVCKISKKIVSSIQQTGIMCFSETKYKTQNVGWYNWTEKLFIYSSKREKKLKKEEFQTIQFQYQLQPLQVVYFSLCLPYTFTKLKNTLKQLHIIPKIIGQTLIGNPIIAITQNHLKSDKILLIIARQHSCETSSSYTVQGVLRCLNSNLRFVTMLKYKIIYRRSKYNIIIFPMANPDGVIHGNSRSNLFGHDINRKWDENIQKSQSIQVLEILNFLKKQKGQIQYLIDMHGHSRKLNTFAYFSSTKKFATLMAFQMSNKLSYFKISDCTFNKLNQNSGTTLRELSKTLFDVQKSITLQTSMFGWTDNEGKIHSFSSNQLMKIGQALLESICNIQFKKIHLSQKTIMSMSFGQEQVNSDSEPQNNNTNKGSLIQKNVQKIKKQQLQLSVSPKQRLRSNSFRFRQTLKRNETFHKAQKRRQRAKTQYHEPSKIVLMLNSTKKQGTKIHFRNKYLKLSQIKKKEKIQLHNEQINILNNTMKGLSSKRLIFLEQL